MIMTKFSFTANQSSAANSSLLGNPAPKALIEATSKVIDSINPSENPFLISNANKEIIEPIRMMIYGKPKTRKTAWAGTAGETHRVTILDGENGTSIFKILPESTQKNIQRIPLAGKPNAPALAMFLSLLFRQQKFLWSLTEERLIEPAYVNSDHHYIDVDLMRLTTDDVLVIDSWTKLSADSGLQYMIDKKIDPFSGKKKEFDFYGFQDLVLDAIMGAFNCLPCHLIIVAHEQFYVHKVKEGVIIKEITRQQVVSSTGKHAAKLPATVSDMLWFESVAPGPLSPTGNTHIYTGASEYRDGGCRNLPAGEHMFDKFGFKDFCALAGIPPAKTLTRPKPEAFQYYSGKSILAMMNG
jgi:hypothetical protein